MFTRLFIPCLLISIAFYGLQVDARTVGPRRHNDIKPRHPFNPFRVPIHVSHEANVDARSNMNAVRSSEQDQIIARSIGEKSIRRNKKRNVKKRACTAPTTSPVASVTSSSSSTPTSTSSQVQIVSTPILQNAPVIPSTTIVPSSSSVRTSTSTSSTAKPASTSASSSGRITVDPEGDGPFAGETTYYNLGTHGNSIGACGNRLVDSDLIAAASEYLFDSWPGATGNPNTNPICGKFAKVTYQGKSVVVRIEDRCPGCAKRHLDLSPSAFSQLASFDVGLMDVTWSWVATAQG